MTGTASRGGGSLFSESVLVVHKRMKLMGDEYTVFNQHDQQIGAARELRQSAAKKFVRFAPQIDAFLTHKWQVVDANGQVALTLTRRSKIGKLRIIVESGDGREVGQIIQPKAFGKTRFSLESSGQQIGSLNAEDRRASNFNVQDTSGRMVARITRTTRGFITTVQIHEQLAQPLHSLVVASVFGIDFYLEGGSSGLSTVPDLLR